MEPRSRARDVGPLRVIEAGTLARFAPGLDWPGIRALDRSVGPTLWRNAIASAEERGLIEWDREERMWVLTDAGREAVRSVS